MPGGVYDVASLRLHLTGLNISGDDNLFHIHVVGILIDLCRGPDHDAILTT
jgi:hypothetical protein